MASLASTTIFSLFLLLSLAIQPHAARESKFFTKLIHYISNSPIVSSPSSSPAPAPVLVPGLEPMPEPLLAPGLSPAPAPAPVEKEYGYGLYGQGLGEYSSEEYRTSTLDQGFKNENPEYDEEEKGSPPFENSKLLGSYNNGYSNNENVYSNENNGYNNNGYSYTNNYNDNGNRFSTSMNENRNGYTTESYNNNINGYTTNSYNQNNNDNYNTMRFGNDAYNNGNEFMSQKDENDAYNNNNNNNNGYVMEQQGLSDTRFLENGKYYRDANNNGNNQETRYEEEVNDNGSSQEYYNRNVNEKSKYEFDTMEEYERQQGYPENYPSGYVP